MLKLNWKAFIVELPIRSVFVFVVIEVDARINGFLFLFRFNFHLQVNDLTRSITKLEKELAEKERYVALSQMRLGNRAQRIGIELCRDKAHDTLMRELMALKDTYQKLSHMIDQVIG